MKFQKLNFKNNSELEISTYVSEDNTILITEVFGYYKKGSYGNSDGAYLFSIIASHYFYFNPILLISDFTNLEYSWGDKILKTLDFFCEIGRDNDEKEKKHIIILSEKNEKAMLSLLNTIENKNILLCYNKQEAIDLATEEVEKYLM